MIKLKSEYLDPKRFWQSNTMNVEDKVKLLGAVIDMVSSQPERSKREDRESGCGALNSSDKLER